MSSLFCFAVIFVSYLFFDTHQPSADIKIADYLLLCLGNLAQICDSSDNYCIN